MDDFFLSSSDATLFTVFSIIHTNDFTQLPYDQQIEETNG